MRGADGLGGDAGGQDTTVSGKRSVDFVTKRKQRPSKPASADPIQNGGRSRKIPRSGREVPTKRLKTEIEAAMMEPDARSPYKNRASGGAHDAQDEDSLSEQFVIENTTFVSMDCKETSDSKDTVSTSVTGTESNGTRNDESYSIASDGATETSSVAHLRGWLGDFTQKQRDHFETSTSIGCAPPNALKVTRHRVQKAKSEVPPTPLPPTASIALQRKLEAGTMSVGRARSTPVRFKTKRHSDVQADNDGYKSVAKLAAWLADDPTKSKKEVTTIRRGANVIAKSRTFDKGLANVIIEQHSIRTGTVQQEKRRLETEDEQSAISPSSMSVSHKKEWLANAFNKSSEATAPRAKTELVTEQEKRDEATERAKQLWRERASAEKKKPDTASKAKEKWRERATTTADRRVALPPMSPSANRRRQMASPARTRSTTKQPADPAPVNREKENAVGRDTAADEPTSTEDHGVSDREMAFTEARQRLVERSKNAKEPKKEESPEKEKDVGFSEARRLLVQRSKKNGHSVVVLSKVGRKTAKFERLEAENRRRSSSGHGHLKTHWDGASTEGPSNGYVKTHVEDPVPKKTFDQLP